MPFLTSGFPHKLAELFLGVALMINSGVMWAGTENESMQNAGSVPVDPAKNQMVCHAGKILTVLNEDHSKKSLTCMKRSTGKTYSYNNLADIFAEGWWVVDINNDNTWLFSK